MARAHKWKVVQLGPHPVNTLSPMVKVGYKAGMKAFRERIQYEADGSKLTWMLTDREFTVLLDQCTPVLLSEEEAGTYRAHFILGWVWMFLYDES